MPSDRHSSRKLRPWQPLKRFMQRLLRFLFYITGRRSSQAGFVFPTTLLLVLMLLLTVSALTFRTFTRSTQNIGQRDQQVIYNSATPAVDRAKAKIEFMFRDDPRFPSGVPPSDFLADMMAIEHDPANGYVGFANSRPVPPLDPDINDPYTLPDEERVDINGDGLLDNAWSFDSSGELVVYSVLVDDTFFNGDAGSNVNVPAGGSISLDAAPDQDKADALVTRTGPLATTEAIAACKGAAAEGGWQIVQNADNSTLQKNFQVDVFVADSNAANNTFETLEFQQSRIAARSNKWGAWFRYDLEIFPGSDFNWNGAMHTDGNISLHARVEPHMVSSHNSCLYSKRSSEITLGEFDNNSDGVINLADGDFQGQAIKGYVEDDAYTTGGLRVHLWDQNDNTKPLTNNTANFTQGTDSVTGGRPSEIAMNPLKLFTEDIAEHTAVGDWERDEDWTEDDSEFVKRGRIYNDEVSRPFVDDFYRADNRWGPKPRYDSRDSSLDLANNAEVAGDPITGNATLTSQEDGLDGYWERQAISKGLRLIVGQRLELGNVNGWNNDPSGVAPDPEDPLYPPAQEAGVGGLNANNRFGGNHEYMQRKSLRDNLAAVQGMVVYHYQGPGTMAANGEFPAACVALTAHPGTKQTIRNSRNFDTWLGSATNVKTDFLTGDGTNGWEFQYPTAYDTESEFAAALGTGQPLGAALRNLARFAGDPSGGAPSFRAIQDAASTTAVAHPFPYMAMWGDFSPLRRIFEEYLDAPTVVGYTNSAFSYADKATLHSAACTLSLLAYNLEGVKSEFDGVSDADWGALATGLSSILVNTGAPTANEIDITNAAAAETFEWATKAAAAGAVTVDQVAQINAIAEYWQIERDRTFGFLRGVGLAPEAPTPPAPSFGTYDQANGTFNLVTAGSTYTTAGPYELSCDPNFFSSKGINNAEQALTLALALCPKKESATTVKYPSLYYLFPVANHGQKSTATIADIASTEQPATEAYIDATAVVAPAPDNVIPTYTVNNAVTYATVSPTNLAAVPGGVNPSSWVLPADTATAGAFPANVNDELPPFQIQIGSNISNVAFLDKGIANGRQQLSVRLLDIDVDKLVSDKPGSDYWLSADLDAQAEGVVYAFREDAIREDEIVRPASTSVTAPTCQAPSAGGYPYTIETNANCQMNAVPGAEQDPPLTAERISLKPVDFAPDPLRRADGFRFRTSNGDPVDFSGPSLDRQVGMTFVTDNAAYIQGDFNLHSTDGTPGNIVEEFDQTLQDGDVGYRDPFYNNRVDLNLDTFANLNVDHWRPVEILADEINILSEDFNDGAMIDAFIKRRPGSDGGADSSYMNLYRPRSNSDRAPNFYILEDPIDVASPIYIDRNGTFYVNSGGIGSAFYSDAAFDNNNEWVTRAYQNNNGANRNLQSAPDNTYINAVFVSGIVPQRPEQSYGGLHNFPRFNEYWNNDDLFIQGSFIQLNFSTAGTAPFDHDSWEPGETTLPGNDGEWIGYYQNPDRNWGFDVGLLYVPPAPAARRFVSIGAPRNEYYREIAADDPYIKNLRCAEDANGTQLFSNLCNK